jgi:hypothetical protein
MNPEIPTSQTNQPIQPSEPFVGVPAPVPVVSPPQTSKPKVIIIAAVVGGLIMIGGIGLLVMRLGSSTEKSTSQPKQQSTVTKKQETPAATAGTRTCKAFKASEFDPIINGAPEKTDGMFATFKNSSGKWTLLFKYLFSPSTLAYDSPDIVIKSIKSVSRFNDQFSQFEWQLSLRGSIASDTPEAKKIANERSQKVKQELIDAGIPADRLIIKDPRMDTVPAQNYINIDDRYVQAVISANCT